MNGTFFVLGARGVQGRPVARALAASGCRVVTPTRSAAAAAELAHEGFSPVVVDVHDTGAVRSALAGCDGAFLHIPTGGPPEGAGGAAGASPRPSNADAIISLLKVIGDPSLRGPRGALFRTVVSTSGIVPVDDERARGFAGTIRLGRVLMSMRSTVLTLRPTMFLEDLLDTSPLERVLGVGGGRESEPGVLRYPLGVRERIAWVTAEAVGRHAAAVLLAAEWSPDWFAVLGGRVLSVSQVAGLIGKRVGRAIIAADWQVDAYERELSRSIGPDSAKSTADVYRTIAANFEQLRGALAGERRVTIADPVDVWLATLPG